MKKKLALALSIALATFPVSTWTALADTSTGTASSVAITATSTDGSGTVAVTTNNSSSTTVSDQTTDTSTPPVDGNGQPVSPGLSPDSPFYWLSQLIGKLQVALTFDPAKKAELLERQALQNLASAQKLAQAGKTDASQKALDAYSEKVAAAQNFLDQVKDPASESFQTLASALSNVNAKNAQVLGDVLEKLPPQAAQKVALTVVHTMEKAEARYTKQQNEQLTRQAAAALKTFRESLGQKGIHGIQKVTEDEGTVDNQDGGDYVKTAGEEHKAEIAQEREKGQQGAKQRSSRKSDNGDGSVQSPQLQAGAGVHGNSEGSTSMSMTYTMGSNYQDGQAVQQLSKGQVKDQQKEQLKEQQKEQLKEQLKEHGQANGRK